MRHLDVVRILRFVGGLAVLASLVSPLPWVVSGALFFYMVFWYIPSAKERRQGVHVWLPRPLRTRQTG